ncbi:NUDIX hydrolase [Bacillus sp. TL12]|uniref:NUDIX hydrolase n=1 Tax=Bacillus sp. TL12 TaxID=2894756 RepID=UPI001F52818B|nr:NUDIX hydrolase [Bacillus sp. TL12]MCI0765471.1 NUDIX hydrolase [Bacillus sp. TL12]
MGYLEDMRKLVGNHPLIITGSHVIVLNKQNEILLQLRTDFNMWGIIGGALGYGETLEEAAKREAFEETGLIVKDLELFHTFSGPNLFQIYPNGDQVYGVMVVYICRNYEGELQCDRNESKELLFFPLHALPHNIGAVPKMIIDQFQQSVTMNTEK